MRFPGLRLFLLLLCAPALQAEETSRTWTDTTGRTFTGTYLSATPEKITIQRAVDGKAFEIERTRLSQDDLTYVDTLGKTPPPPETRPAPPDSGPGFRPDFRQGRRFGRMLAGYDPTQSNFAAPWPKSAGIEKEPPITVIEENAEAKRFIYECPHFRLQCDVPLRRDLLVKVTSVFEACYQVHRAVPLNNRRTRSPDAPKLNAFLFRTLEDYQAAGGMPGTVGSYHTRGDRFLIPLEGLGIRKVGSGYEFDFGAGFHHVYHEIAHQLWADLDEYAGTWMNEGFAEYMACAPYANGRFNLASQPAAAWDFAIGARNKGVASRALGINFNMPPLKDFMNWSQARFYEDPNRNYALGLLLVYYFLHLDGDGSGAGFKACIRACQEGKTREEALQVLLAGRTYEQLQKEFATALRSKGVQIGFE